MNNKPEFNNYEVKNNANYKSRNDNTPNSYYHNKNKLDDNDKFSKEDGTKFIHKKTQEISSIVKTFAAVVAASMIGVAGLNILPTNTTAKAQIECSSAKNEIFYYVELLDYVEDDTYYIVLYNDFTNRAEQIEDNAIEGAFENLAAEMTYTLAVKQGDRIIASKIVKTSERMQDYKPYFEPSSDDPTQSDYPSNNYDPTGANNQP